MLQIMSFFSAKKVCLFSATSVFALAGSTLLFLHLKFGMRLINYAITKENTTNDRKLLPSQFSILSQNIWCSFFSFGAYRQKRLQLLFDNITKDNPDIICLQEMFIFSIGFCGVMLSGDFEYLHQRLLSIGYHFFNNPLETLPFFGCNSGLMIYSKYAMKETKGEAFDIKHRRYISCKGYLNAVFSVEVKEEQRILNIVNTHLEHENADYKISQIKQVLYSMI